MFSGGLGVAAAMVSLMVGRRIVLRWSNRVAAYAFALTTDQYPPFRLAV